MLSTTASGIRVWHVRCASVVTRPSLSTCILQSAFWPCYYLHGNRARGAVDWRKAGSDTASECTTFPGPLSLKLWGHTNTYPEQRFHMGLWHALWPPKKLWCVRNMAVRTTGWPRSARGQESRNLWAAGGTRRCLGSCRMQIVFFCQHCPDSWHWLSMEQSHKGQISHPLFP